MNLGELRRSIKKLPLDMDDMHVVMICFNKEKEKKYDLLAATGIINEKGIECVALVSDEVCHEMIRTNTLKMKKEIEIDEID